MTENYPTCVTRVNGVRSGNKQEKFSHWKPDFEKWTHLFSV